MRIKISQTDGALPLIDELPGYGIGQLEGYNGVGKSLTVSILEICSGVRPRMERQAWRGLCDGMGHLEIEATELSDVAELQWVLDGALLWEASKEADVTGPPGLDWFVDVRVDGHSVQSLDEVRPLFAVERVNGDVGLIEELAERAEFAVRELDGFAAGMLGSEKLEEVERRIGGLGRVLEELSVERIRERSRLAAQRKADLAAAEAVMAEALKRQAELDDAVRLRTRIEEISLRGDELDAKIAELDEQIARLTAERRVIEHDLAAAENAAARSDDLRNELASATRSYKTASTRLRNVTGELARASQIAGIGDDEDPKHRRADLEAQLAELRRERIEVDAGPAVVELIDRVSPPLTHAVGLGLGEQTLLLTPSAGAWTVAEVAEGLMARRDQIAGVPSPRDAGRIDELIATAEAQLVALDDVVRLRDRRVKAAARQNEAQETSQQLSERLDSSSTARLDELRTTRRMLDDQLSERGGQRAVQVYRRDALGAPQERDALSDRLSALLLRLGLKDVELEAEHADALRVAEHERDAYTHLRDLARAAAADEERDTADVDRAILALHESPEFGWMITRLRHVPTVEKPPSEKLAAILRLQRLSARADERLTDFRQLFPGLGASLEAAAEELRGRTPKAAIHVAEVFRWLEKDAADWFSDEDFREALLGEDAQDVQIDLHTRQVVWRSSEGQHHTKPIEALSSGERAFAFTQARLALLQQRAGRVANRLIALDEFGAFVSANRIRQLAEYLRRWREKHQGDQILVILPASQDYVALARASDGAQAKRYERMAAALRDREWFVEEFDAA
jgi:hypothetical protein